MSRFLILRNYAFLPPGRAAYAGFDGDILSDTAGEPGASDCRRLATSPASRLLHLSEGPSASTLPFLGIDLGYYLSADSKYSLILNAPGDWALNPHLLFDTAEIARAALAAWLAADAPDREQFGPGEEPRLIWVHGRRIG